MRFLITTEPDDTHAALVKIALEGMGHEVRLLFLADQPTRQRNSIYINHNSYLWKSSDRYTAVVNNDYDVVWWRRVRRPYIPKDYSHPEDYLAIIKENNLFYESLTYNLAPSAWWINRKEAALRANSKLLQLKIARQCGFLIPETLCSNDPKEIRYFLLRHESEGVIFKPLCPSFWFEEKQTKIAYTSKITFLDLPNNKVLQLSPGIFQKEIKKSYELRITCFGDYIVATKLNSQNHEEGKLDWRAIPTGMLQVESYTLPEEFQNKIRLFMKRIGIVFGAFDFIVTPEGEYIFLEVNEQGQFLWIEEYNPEITMLDIFVQFLVNKTQKFVWQTNKRKHSIEMYRDAMTEIVSLNLQRHVDLNSAKPPCSSLQ